MATTPVVSVVIPTFERPGLVVRAVRSALAQTLSDLEVIVVVDGRDAATTAALAAIGDPRVRVHVPERHLGNADARNAGVARARAAWVAFLDDDDEWMPEKVERQLRVAEGARDVRPIVACRMVARSERSALVWPRRVPRPGEAWSEYFFCRTTPFTGEGMVTLSTIFTAKTLVEQVPFTSGLARHMDPDWLLRAARVPGVPLLFPDSTEPLIVWNVDVGRSRITTRRDWRESWDWARRNRDLFTPRAYAAFVLHVVGSSAAASGAWGAFGSLLIEAFRRGRPAAVDVASHLANFAVPAGVQRRVAAWYGKRTASA